MALTKVVVKQAKPEEKTYMMSDVRDLSLEVPLMGKDIGSLGTL